LERNLELIDDGPGQYSIGFHGLVTHPIRAKLGESSPAANVGQLAPICPKGHPLALLPPGTLDPVRVHVETTKFKKIS
jgi:hypothetical protein